MKFNFKLSRSLNYPQIQIKWLQVYFFTFESAFVPYFTWWENHFRFEFADRLDTHSISYLYYCYQSSFRVFQKVMQITAKLDRTGSKIPFKGPFLTLNST